MTIKDCVRWLVSLALMMQVWRGAHWSVALTLTFLTLRAEIEDYFA